MTAVRRCLPHPAVRALALVAGACLLVPLAGAGAASAAATPSGAAPYSNNWTRGNPGIHRSSPTFGTLSVGKVVLQADMLGYLRALRSDGSQAWQADIDPHPGIRTASESSPAIGDLDGNGSNEVVVGAGSIDPAQLSEPGGVVAYNGDGSVKWRWLAPDRFGTQGRPDGAPDGIYSSPAIGDVNGDGHVDVVYGGWDHNIWALDGRNGLPLAGFPFENTDTVFSSPALYDTNADGVLDIVIGGDETGNPAVPGSYNGGVLRVISATGGRTTQLLRRNVADIVASSPAIGDIDGDGRVEAVFGVGGYWHASDTRHVYAVHLDDGSDVPGWPQVTEGEVFSSPALGDVVPGDGGGQEVVATDLKGYLYAWRGNGTLAWRTSPADKTGFFGGPSIADVNGDGKQDVLTGYGFGGAIVFDGINGYEQRRFPGGAFASEATPLVADFGGTVGRQVIVSGFDPARANWVSGQIASFALPPAPYAADWPMFHKDARHLGGSPTVAMVHGSIAAHYDALGGANGFLGQATTPERATPTMYGRYNHFQGGSIYWSPASGAWSTRGSIQDAWAGIGWEQSLLGFPITDQNALSGGAFNRFQGGQIYWSPSTGAHEIHGSIFGAWGRSGYENGPLGYPTTNETPTPSRPGAYNQFPGGSVYWSPATNAHVVVGPVRDAWARSGWENGCLGFPVTDTHAVVTGGTTFKVSDFQGGTIRWSASTGPQVTCR